MKPTSTCISPDHLRRSLAVLLCSGLLGLLAACGGSNPPAATPVPTATTTSAGNTAATATTSGDTTGANPTAPSTGNTYQADAKGSGTGLLQKARQAMNAGTIKSYHFVDTNGAQTGGNGVTIVQEGDRILPDKLKMTISTGTTGAMTSIAAIINGDKTWASTDGGKTWMSAPADGSMTETTLKEITDDLNDAKAADDAGDTTLDGVAVHHLRLDRGEMSANGGTASFGIEAWTDKTTNYVLQLQLNLSGAAAGQSTTTGGRTIKLSRINDPGLRVDPPAAGAVDQPTPTTGDTSPPTDTPEPTEAPVPTDTPGS